MKTLHTVVLALGALLLAAEPAIAQDKKLSIGIGLGGASAKSKSDNSTGKGIGVNYYLNVVYNFNYHLSAGLELNGNAVVIADPDLVDVTVSTTAITGILAKGKYAFGAGKVNPFVGLMAGPYLVAPGSVSLGATGISLDFDRKTTFGFAPEVGIELGAFQLATSYHFVGKYQSVYVDPTGDYSFTVESNYTIWQFNIGFNIGLIGR